MFFSGPERISPPIIHLDNAYNGTVIIEKVNLSIEMISKIVFVGLNGCGKITLLKGLNGNIILMSGLLYKIKKQFNYIMKS